MIIRTNVPKKPEKVEEIKKPESIVIKEEEISKPSKEYKVKKKKKSEIQFDDFDFAPLETEEENI